MINIKIKTDNDAFQDGNFGFEVARILREIAKDLEETNSTKCTYRDINGNTVCYLS